MLMPYPNEMPTYAFSLVIDKLRGKEVDTPLLIQAAWVIGGYAAGKAIPSGPLVVSGDFMLSPDFVAEISFLEFILLEEKKLLSSSPEEQEASLAKGLIDWRTVAKICAKLFMLFLLEKNPNA